VEYAFFNPKECYTSLDYRDMTFLCSHDALMSIVNGETSA
jgi:hypothetical protein